MDHRLTHVKARTIKHLEENSGEYLFDLEVNKDFLGHIKHTLWKKKLYKINFIKINNLFIKTPTKK